jgi:hypothetical protein
MALSQYFYVPGNPEFISYNGRCWRRLTQQSLAGTKLTPGIDVEGYDNVNECLGISTIFEIGELGATIKTDPTGSQDALPMDPDANDIFGIGKLKATVKVYNPLAGTILMDDIIPASQKIIRIGRIGANARLFTNDSDTSTVNYTGGDSLGSSAYTSGYTTPTTNWLKSLP